jgi:cyclohexanone monooxygenase
MIESQVNYILQLIQMVAKTQTQAVVKAEVQDQFNEMYRNSLKVQYGNQAVSVGTTRWRKKLSLWPTYTWKFGSTPAK